MLHSDGLPLRVLDMLREASGRAMTTAEVARALGVADKRAFAACAALERAGQLESEFATNPGTKRRMRAWRIVQQPRAALWDPKQDSANERLKRGRRRAQQMACGPYPGRDIRYQLPADWEPPGGRIPRCRRRALRHHRQTVGEADSMKTTLHTTLRECGQRLLRAKDGGGEWRAERAARAALIRDGMSDGAAAQLTEAQACVVRAIKRAAARAPGGAAA